MRTKRIIVATLSGLLFGFVCFGLASSGSGLLALPITLQIISSRTLIGFAIGISCLRLGHWAIHGAVLGFIFSIPLAFSGLMAPEMPGFDPVMMFFSTVIMGLIYGLLTEVITSVLFKAKQQ
jgi:hypothetical protein